MLQIEPTLVREISAEMSEPPDGKGVVSALDDELTSSVVRFIRSLAASSRSDAFLLDGCPFRPSANLGMRVAICRGNICSPTSVHYTAMLM